MPLFHPCKCRVIPPKPKNLRFQSPDEIRVWQEVLDSSLFHAHLKQSEVSDPPAGALVTQTLLSAASSREHHGVYHVEGNTC